MTRSEPRPRDLSAVIAAAQHVWAAVAFVFAWLHFEYVTALFRHEPWQLYTLYLLAVAGVAARYVTGVRHGHQRWHRILFDALTIFFIALGVNLTGGIRSDLWLVFFIFVIAETLASSARGILITLLGTVFAYTIATWPRMMNREWLELYFTHLFFLGLVASVAWTLAREERRRQIDVGALREALAISEERRRLARDLHDGIGHVLTRVILSLEMARRQVGAPPEAMNDTLAQQADALRGAMHEMRQLVGTLRTDTSSFDLPTAVRTLASQMSNSSSLQVSVEAPEEPLPLAPYRQYQLSRVVQEALTNCLRHASAHRAAVRIRTTTSAVGLPRVVVTITDDGRGFDPEEARLRGGNGLRGMEERLEPYGGRVVFDSMAGRGTTVTAELPGELL